LNKNRVVRLCGGLALAVGVSLVPMGAVASNHTPAPAHAGADGSQNRMAPPAAAGHHDGMAGHHATPPAHHAPPAAHHAAPPVRHAAAAHPKPYVHRMAPKHDTGAVEGGSGASDNDGGSVTGDHAPAHVHGDNQGGDIH
jgi:hypothetical protein